MRHGGMASQTDTDESLQEWKLALRELTASAQRGGLLLTCNLSRCTSCCTSWTCLACNRVSFSVVVSMSVILRHGALAALAAHAALLSLEF